MATLADHLGRARGRSVVANVALRFRDGRALWGGGTAAASGGPHCCDWSPRTRARARYAVDVATGREHHSASRLGSGISPVGPCRCGPTAADLKSVDASIVSAAARLMLTAAGTILTSALRRQRSGCAHWPGFNAIRSGTSSIGNWCRRQTTQNTMIRPYSSCGRRRCS